MKADSSMPTPGMPVAGTIGANEGGRTKVRLLRAIECNDHHPRGRRKKAMFRFESCMAGVCDGTLEGGSETAPLLRFVAETPKARCGDRRRSLAVTAKDLSAGDLLKVLRAIWQYVRNQYRGLICDLQQLKQEWKRGRISNQQYVECLNEVLGTVQAFRETLRSMSAELASARTGTAVLAPSDTGLQAESTTGCSAKS